jgi:hypothetical protein
LGITRQHPTERVRGLGLLKGPQCVDHVFWSFPASQRGAELMFLLFGTRTGEVLINVVSFVCGYCRVNAEQHVVKRSTRFTLFFIPLFSFSTSHVNVCTNCGGVTKLTKSQAQHSLDWARSNGS